MQPYRWLLWLCPPALRREYGAAMEETFARRLADARHAGPREWARVWSRELAGLLALAASERWGAFARERRRRRKQESMGKAARMEGIGLEMRQAARRLVRSPAFTAASVLTLALAIGANVSIFAVVQRVVLNPLPYPDSDRLIELDHGALGLHVVSGLGNTSGLYFHYSERSRLLERAALYRNVDVTVTGDGDPERLRAVPATPSLAAVLSVSPALGRWFTEQEGTIGASPVAVLSHGLWARRYRSDPAVVGRPLMLAGVPTAVVGVMPASFAFPDPRVDLWLAEPASRTTGFGLWNYSGVARLREGATAEAARAELNGLIADLPAAFPGDSGASGNVDAKLVFTGRTLKEATVGSVARALWILLASVGVVLLVACANVANLFLVRSEARQREVAVRRALGAGRLGIARYFLTESLWLSIGGSVIGLALAWGGVRALVAFGPATLPRLHEIRLDGVAIAFTSALTVLAAAAFGAIPLSRGIGLTASLYEGGHGSAARGGREVVRHLLMGAQVALALVLVVSSGLMVRSFQNLRAVDPGFNPSSVLTFSIALPAREYATQASVLSTHHAILDRLSALPGVSAVSASTCLPLAGGCNGNTLRVEGRTYPQGTIPPLALFRAVAGGYFETMGMRLVSGRGINRGDVERSEPVVVLSEALAKSAFPNQNPIGQRVASNRPPARFGGLPDFTWLTIVGVVSNTPLRTLAEVPMPQMYMPMSIAPGPGNPVGRIGPNVSFMSYVVRTATPPLDLVPSVRRAIDAIDRNLALAQIRTMQDTVDRASAQMAFTMVLLAIAATVAVMLGVVGIYGVMSYVVAQRTGEIGVRLALGAEPGDVAGLIVRQGAVVALAGIGVGLAAAFAGSRLIESLLYRVSARDPGVFAATTVILLGAALVACWVPARRASRLNPLEALRTE